MRADLLEGGRAREHGNGNVLGWRSRRPELPLDHL